VSKVRTLRVTRDTLARFESGVALVLAVHASMLWATADIDLWVWSITGFLALLGILAVVGLVRPTPPAVSVVRGGLAVAIAVLVGEATGSLTGLFWVWFTALAFVYPVTLPPMAAGAAVPLVAVSYGFTVHAGTAAFPMEDALLRGGVLGAIGMVGFAVGLSLHRLLGDKEDAETRVREMRGMLDAAFETASNGMAFLDLEGTILETNQALADFLGRSVDSLIGVGWGSLLPPQERPGYTEQVAALIDGAIWSFQAESRFVLRDRRIRFGLVGVSLVTDAGGRPRYLFAHVTNITERVRSEQRVRRSEAHYRNLFELAPVPLLQVDLTAVAGILDVWRSQGVEEVASHLEDSDQLASAASSIDFLALNEHARRVFRAADHAEFNAAATSGILGPGYRDLVSGILQGMWERAGTVETGTVLNDLYGAEHDGMVRLAIPEVDGAPEYARSLLAFTDVTEALRSRTRLQRTELQLRALMGAAPVVLFAVDGHGVFTLSEGQGLAALGLEPGEVVGRSVFEMYRDHPSILEGIRTALGGDATTLTADVGTAVFEIRLTPLREQDVVTGVMGVAVDVTERVRSGENLEELVEAKDRFLTAVSHELRTPLTSVVGFARQLETRLESLSSEDIRTIVQTLAAQAVELGDLVDDLLVVNRSERGEVSVSSQPVELWSQIDKVLSARPLEAGLRLENGGGEAKVLGDPMRIRQIIRNLLTNAERHGGPHVTVRVIAGPETTSLFVIDDGEGVADEDRISIFEPYERAGSRLTDSVGLGLTVSRDLARRMGGDLTYAYYRGHSFFELRLPTG
jgi:PAS domain S-box-containing protein